MFEPTDILISVSGQYVMRMLAGDKTIELRRRAIRVAPGTRVWIYTKAPCSTIEAVGIVEQIVTASPRKLWTQFKSQAGISSSEFEDYFVGINNGCAIVFEHVHKIDPGLSMAEIRSRAKQFHPPQFFKRLKANSPELNMLRERMTSDIFRPARTRYAFT